MNTTTHNTTPSEHHELVANVIAWLRAEAPLAWHPVGFLGTLPGWDDYASDEITARGWARVLETSLASREGN
jgi:hypothetical protein